MQSNGNGVVRQGDRTGRSGAVVRKWIPFDSFVCVGYAVGFRDRVCDDLLRALTLGYVQDAIQDRRTGR